MFGGYFIECCWNTPSDFLGGLWKGVQIEKKLENNGIDLYHVCSFFFPCQRFKEIPLYCCPLFHFFSAFEQCQGRSSFNTASQTFFILWHTWKLLLCHWGKLAATHRRQLACDLWLSHPHLAIHWRGDPCPVVHVTIRKVSITHSKSLSQTLPNYQEELYH